MAKSYFSASCSSFPGKTLRIQFLIRHQIPTVTVKLSTALTAAPLLRKVTTRLPFNLKSANYSRSNSKVSMELTQNITLDPSTFPSLVSTFIVPIPPCQNSTRVSVRNLQLDPNLEIPQKFIFTTVKDPVLQNLRCFRNLAKT